MFVRAFYVKVRGISWGVRLVLAAERTPSHGVFGEVLWWELCK